MRIIALLTLFSLHLISYSFYLPVRLHLYRKWNVRHGINLPNEGGVYEFDGNSRPGEIPPELLKFVNEEYIKSNNLKVGSPSSSSRLLKNTEFDSFLTGRKDLRSDKLPFSPLSSSSMLIKPDAEAKYIEQRQQTPVSKMAEIKKKYNDIQRKRLPHMDPDNPIPMQIKQIEAIEQSLKLGIQERDKRRLERNYGANTASGDSTASTTTKREEERRNKEEAIAKEQRKKEWKDAYEDGGSSFSSRKATKESKAYSDSYGKGNRQNTRGPSPSSSKPVKQSPSKQGKSSHEYDVNYEGKENYEDDNENDESDEYDDDEEEYEEDNEITEEDLEDYDDDDDDDDEDEEEEEEQKQDRGDQVARESRHQSQSPSQSQTIPKQKKMLKDDYRSIVNRYAESVTNKVHRSMNTPTSASSKKKIELEEQQKKYLFDQEKINHRNPKEQQEYEKKEFQIKKFLLGNLPNSSHIQSFPIQMLNKDERQQHYLNDLYRLKKPNFTQLELDYVKRKEKQKYKKEELKLEKAFKKEKRKIVSSNKGRLIMDDTLLPTEYCQLTQFSGSANYNRSFEEFHFASNIYDYQNKLNENQKLFINLTANKHFEDIICYHPLIQREYFVLKNTSLTIPTMTYPSPSSVSVSSGSASSSSSSSTEGNRFRKKEFFDLITTITDNLNNLLKVEIPTKIQDIAIPLLSIGYNTILHAQTGSGKTLGFLLPLVYLVNPDVDYVRHVSLVYSLSSFYTLLFFFSFSFFSFPFFFSLI
jgi:hypothetical protein